MCKIKIAVTGSSGKLGQFVVNDLLDNGFDITCIDQTACQALPLPTRLVHLEQLGEVYDVLASSECAYGIGFAADLHVPDYLPLDEDHPLRPEDCYGLGKLITEDIASSFWRRSEISSFALRFGFIHLPDESES